jgi:hypothetical protein
MSRVNLLALFVILSVVLVIGRGSDSETNAAIQLVTAMAKAQPAPNRKRAQIQSIRASIQIATSTVSAHSLILPGISDFSVPQISFRPYRA